MPSLVVKQSSSFEIVTSRTSQSLSTAEVAAYWHDIHTVARMIEQVFAPCHMNYQLLGNLVPHLHVHLVPRYLDDPAPGKPLPS